MAVSNSTDFTLNRNEIIDKALELVGAKEANLTPDATEVAEASEWLNLMLKQWQVDTDMSMWVRRTGTLFLEQDKKTYQLGTSGTYATVDDEEDISETTLDAAEAAAETTISVTSTSGFANSDQIGILLDDDTIHWSTISSFVTDDTVTIATGLASAAASGNMVYTYTSIMHRPYKIMEVVLRDTDDRDIILEPISQNTYMGLNDKASSGNPTGYYFDPLLTNSKISFWPVIESNDYKVLIRYVKPYDDMDAASNNLDFPVAWTMAIIYGLAMHLCVKYSVEDTNYNRIIRQASVLFKRANAMDIEYGSFEIEPDPSEGWG